MNIQRTHYSLIGSNIKKVVLCIHCLQRVFLRAVYSQAQGCMWAAPQLGGNVEQPWLMCKYDVIHNTEST